MQTEYIISLSVGLSLPGHSTKLKTADDTALDQRQSSIIYIPEVETNELGLTLVFARLKKSLPLKTKPS